MNKTFSPKTVVIGDYDYKSLGWGDVSVPVSVVADKTTGELSVVFSKGFPGILMKNMPDFCTFTTKVANV